jgi:hypothetical protein
MSIHTRILFFVIIFIMPLTAYAARCTDYSSCEEAVIAWCAGQHPKADGDRDGIPCENVCSSLEDVEEIKVRINCKNRKVVQ